MRQIYLSVFAFSLTISSIQAQTQPYQNPNLSAHERAVDLCSKLTLEEKAQLLVGGANNFFNDGAVVGGSAETVPGAAGTTTAIPRLGIPETILTDGPAGVRINPTRKGDSRTYYATGL